MESAYNNALVIEYYRTNWKNTTCRIRYFISRFLLSYY